MTVVFGGLLTGLRRDANMVVRSGFSEDKTLLTCIRPKDSPARLATFLRVTVVFGGLLTGLRRDANMVACSGFSEDKTLLTCIRPEGAAHRVKSRRSYIDLVIEHQMVSVGWN